MPTTATAAPPTMPIRWVGVFPDGRTRRYTMRNTMEPVMINGELLAVVHRDGSHHSVRYRLDPVTPVAAGNIFWLTETSSAIYNGVL